MFSIRRLSFGVDLLLTIRATENLIVVLIDVQTQQTIGIVMSGTFFLARSWCVRLLLGIDKSAGKKTVTSEDVLQSMRAVRY
jgi:hypothetical protein